jgi:hypothetical protein
MTKGPGLASARDQAEEDGDGDDDELDIRLRTPGETAARAIVLGAVCRRAYLELPERPEAADDPEGERFDLSAWLRDEGLQPAISPAERRLLETRLGRVPRDDAEAASWRGEALAALGWALRLLDEMPPYDVPADLGALMALIPGPWDKTAAFRGGTQLRDEPAIAAARETAEIWHWRATTADLLLAATGREARELTAVVREVARDAARAGLFPRPIGGDFPVSGQPYRDLPPDDLAVLANVAAERHYALNWLCGFGASWDDVPLDL